MHYLKTIVPTLAMAASIDALAIRGTKARSNELSESPAASECTCSNNQAAGVNVGAAAAKEAAKDAAGAGAVDVNPTDVADTGANAAADAGAADVGANVGAAGAADAAAADTGAGAADVNATDVADTGANAVADAGAADVGANAGADAVAADAGAANAADVVAADTGAEAVAADAGAADAADAGAADTGAEAVAADAGAADAADAGAVDAGAADAGADPAAAGAGAAGAAAQGGAKAIYLMTNQDDNAIIMLPVLEDGTVGEGSLLATGGQGAAMIDMATGEEVATDSLASQSSIRVAGDNLFAVNAGSNSLSMFAIDPANPLQLTVVGQAVETGGDFPTSVAVSSDLSMVCVAHNGVAAGVSCATFDAAAGIGEFDALRPFDLQQTNPPTGPLNGIGQTLFNEDSSMLVTTVKGNPEDPTGAFPGFLSMFSVQDGVVGTEDTQTTPAGSAVLFGTALIPGSNSVLTTDASFGASILDLAKPDQFVATTALDNQAATCWAAVSDLTGTGFVTDVGVNRLAEINTETGELVNDLLSDNGNPGMIDLQAAADRIYALAPGNGSTPCAVTVFDISAGSGSALEIQNFAVPDADNRAMGMAFHQ